MRFALMIEPQQGLTYAEQLAIARTAESVGFETLLRSDHYGSFPVAGLRTSDAWTVIAGLARETTRLRLGTLVSPMTFRIAGSFAKVVATADEMSAGRIEVGLGAGWNEPEHDRLGIPFPPLGERMDRLEDALAILHGLWTEPDGWAYDGRVWHVRDARYGPRPAPGSGRRHPHIIVGGDAKPRGLRLAARYASEYNLTSARSEVAAETRDNLRAACAAEGRDPGTVVFSAMTGVLVGETEAEIRGRTTALLTALGLAPAEGEAWLASRRARWIMGTPEQALERIAAFAKAGVERVVLQDFLPRDLGMIELLGAQVLPAGASL